MNRNSTQLSFTCNKPLHDARSGRWCAGWFGAVAGGFGGGRSPAPYLTGMSDTTNTNSPRSDGLEPLLTVGELSEYLGIPVATLYDWRTDGIGPKAIKLGRALRYPQSSVRLWISEQVDA